MLPSLFVSHGAPNLVLRDSPARDCLSVLGRSLPRPDAILCISAHYETERISVSSDPWPETVYDFGGFEPELYTLTYPAPGNPELASEVVSLLTEAGVDAELERGRGFDHGVWVPLMLMYPDADIPVVQMSVRKEGAPSEHLAVGRALKSLQGRNILILGSGSMTHNLSEAFRWIRAGEDGTDTPDWVDGFADRMIEESLSGNLAQVAENPDSIPGYRDNHPTDEHILPLFVAAGAGDGEGDTRLIHSSAQYHVLRMDILAFGGQELQTALMRS
ncbi:DODA-type extradiol aromatic ring-opening family dioxygenase [Coralliovum pocilloporae]|uniref:DODA-type extradiol aromatic ring-opening family dioxygenase n=1 Tax=Coralliovum pocilloporae TaxID=3066369 RepID=UPI003307B9CD